MLVTAVDTALCCQAAIPSQAGYICSGEHDRQDPGFRVEDFICRFIPPYSQSSTVLTRDVSWINNLRSCIRPCARPLCYCRGSGMYRKSLVHVLTSSQLLFLIVLSGHIQNLQGGFDSGASA